MATKKTAIEKGYEEQKKQFAYKLKNGYTDISYCGFTIAERDEFMPSMVTIRQLNSQSKEHDFIRLDITELKSICKLMDLEVCEKK